MTWQHGDSIGPMTRTVRDSALVLQAYAGHDPRDPSTVKMPVPDFCAELDTDLKGVKVGIPKDFFFDIISDDVEDAINVAVTALQQLGAEIVEVHTSLPRLRTQCLAAYGR